MPSVIAAVTYTIFLPVNLCLPFVFLLVVIALLAIGFSLLIIKLAMPSNIAIGIIIAIVIDVICALYIAMTIIVGRNPQKFGKRFVRLFFKEGYVRY